MRSQCAGQLQAERTANREGGPAVVGGSTASSGWAMLLFFSNVNLVLNHYSAQSSTLLLETPSQFFCLLLSPFTSVLEGQVTRKACVRPDFFTSAPSRMPWFSRLTIISDRVCWYVWQILLRSYLKSDRTHMTKLDIAEYDWIWFVMQRPMSSNNDKNREKGKH